MTVSLTSDLTLLQIYHYLERREWAEVAGLVVDDREDVYAYRQLKYKEA